jgi:hypothetical protein
MASQNTHTTRSKPNKSKPAQPKDGGKGSAATAQNKIDDAADQTFPASDAPASWAGKDIAPQDREDAKKKQS